MKRALQALALLQVALLLGLALRVVEVLRTPLPEFGEVPELPAAAPLPPPRQKPRILPSVTEAIVSADLFDSERGRRAVDEDLDDIVIDEAPLPPPTNMVLTGVMLLGPDPVAILSDPGITPQQRSVRKGEMFGEYEVGEISRGGVVLLGASGQQFLVPLRVDGGGGGAAAAAAAGRPATARPAAAAARGTPAVRPTPGRAGAANEPNQAQSARERAQAIAQRNAEMRARGRGAEDAEPELAAPDPVQARLEALRQLREAARTR